MKKIQEIWSKSYCIMYGIAKKINWEVVRELAFWAITIFIVIKLNMTMSAIINECEQFNSKYEIGTQKNEAVSNDYQSQIQLQY